MLVRGECQALEVWQKFSIQYVSKLAETAPNTVEKVAARYFKYFRNRMAMQERERVTTSSHNLKTIAPNHMHRIVHY